MEIDQGESSSSLALESVSLELIDMGRIDIDSMGDTRTFAEFYRDRFSDSARLAYLLTGDRDSAHDITQDAFEGLHRHWKKVISPDAYLRRSVSNRAADFHRRRDRDRKRSQPSVESAELGASEMLDSLAALPPKQRAAVVMRFYLDLPDAAIAEAISVKPGTVASLIHRALTTLRKAIEQ